MSRDGAKYLAALLLFGSNGIVASSIALPSHQIVLLRTFLGALSLAALVVLAAARAPSSNTRARLVRSPSPEPPWVWGGSSSSRHIAWRALALRRSPTTAGPS